jgi:hypothetical protein
MRATFDADSAREYEFTHGHRPRGNGHWAFDVAWHDNGAASDYDRFWRTGNYAEAKAAAMHYARSEAPNGATDATVSVCT